MCSYHCYLVIYGIDPFVPFRVIPMEVNESSLFFIWIHNNSQIPCLQVVFHFKYIPNIQIIDGFRHFWHPCVLFLSMSVRTRVCLSGWCRWLLFDLLFGFWFRLKLFNKSNILSWKCINISSLLGVLDNLFHLVFKFFESVIRNISYHGTYNL